MSELKNKLVPTAEVKLMIYVNSVPIAELK